MKNHKSNLLINLILINLCFSLLFSCSGDSSSGKENIIDVENALKNFCVGNLGDYASNIDYIRLETNDSSVLGNITDIFLEKGLLFIADDKDVCRIFDSNGKYIRSINRIGRGPEEYLSIRDMYVSSKTGNIMIMDHSGVITEYSMYGDFIRKIAPPDREKSYLGFTLLDDNLIAASIFTILSEEGTSESGYIIYDTTLNVLSRYSRRSGKIEIKGKEGETVISSVKLDPVLINRYSDKTILSSNNSDTLSLLDEKFNPAPWYIFDFGKYSADPVDLIANRVDDNSSVITKYASVILVDNFLFVTFKMRGLAPEPFENQSSQLPPNIILPKNTNVCGVYNTISGKLTLLNQPLQATPGLKDNLKGGPPFWPMFISSKKEMINYYDAFKLIMLQEETGIEFKGLLSITKDLGEADNPVIVIAK